MNKKSGGERGLRVSRPVAPAHHQFSILFFVRSDQFLSGERLSGVHTMLVVQSFDAKLPGFHI